MTTPDRWTRVSFGRDHFRNVHVIESPVQLPEFISPPPAVIDELGEQSIRTILQYAGLPSDDPAQLAKLTPDQLYNLAFNPEIFGLGGDLANCLPERGKDIRTA